MASGGASFPTQAEDTLTVTAPPQGGWPWGYAIRYGAYTYVGYANNAGGTRLAIFDHAAGVDVAPVTSRLESDGFASPADQHDSPAVWKRSDGKLLAVYMPHSGANAWQRVTTDSIVSDPTISAGWEFRENIDSQLGSTAYTYADLHSLSTGPLLFYRDQAGGDNDWAMSTSTDDGDTWDAATVLLGGVHAYARTFMTEDDVLHVVCCDGSLASESASLYHFYIVPATMACFKTDGTPISGPPVDFSDMTLIYDGSTEGVRIPGDICVIGDTVEVTWCVQTGTPGPVIGEDEDYYVARSVAGGPWVTTLLATNVGGITEEFTEGGLVIDRGTLDRLIVSKRTVSNISSPWRIYDVRSSDAGATWSWSVVSVNDGDPAIYPTPVRDYAPELRYVWLQGPDLTSQSVFELGIQGRGRTG